MTCYDEVTTQGLEGSGFTDEISVVMDNALASILDEDDETIEIKSLREKVDSLNRGDLIKCFFLDIDKQDYSEESTEINSRNFLYDSFLALERRGLIPYQGEDYQNLLGELRIVCEDDLGLDSNNLDRFFDDLNQASEMLSQSLNGGQNVSEEVRNNLRIKFQFLSICIAGKVLIDDSDSASIEDPFDYLYRRILYRNDNSLQFLAEFLDRVIPVSMEDVLSNVLRGNRPFISRDTMLKISELYDQYILSEDRESIVKQIERIIEIESINTPLVSDSGVSLPDNVLEDELDSIDRLDIVEFNEQIFRATRMRSDRNRRQIDRWLQGADDFLSVRDKYWILHMNYFSSQDKDSPASLGYFADSYFNDRRQDHGSNVRDYAREFGALRTINVTTGVFPHLSSQDVGVAWLDLNDKLDDYGDRIPDEIDEGNYDRITAVFLSLIIGHFPLDASGRVNEDFLNLVSGGKITLSENGYRGFKRDVFQKLSATSDFKGEFIENVQYMLRGHLDLHNTGDGIPLDSNLARMALLAEHSSIVEVIESGNFTDEILERYPSVRQIRELLMEARDLRYEFLDELEEDDQLELDVIVVEISNMESYSRGEEISTHDGSNRLWGASIRERIDKMQSRYPNLQIIEHLKTRVRIGPMSRILLKISDKLMK